jgi:hypothetical protein
MSDAQAALEFKTRFEAAIKPALSIMDEAAARGMMIQFDAVAQQFGRHTCVNLRVAKVLA